MLRHVGKLSMLSESSWRSIENMEIGKSATKAIIMLLSAKIFTKKVVDGGGGIYIVVVQNFFWPHLGFCCSPLTRNPGYASGDNLRAVVSSNEVNVLRYCT